MAIPASKRRTVWERDGRQCHYCGLMLTLAMATLDHVYPKTRGGRDANWNLVVACADCNAAKGDALAKCDCAICLEAFRKHTELGFASRKVATAVHTLRVGANTPAATGTPIADLLGWRWVPDHGWVQYVPGDHR